MNRTLHKTIGIIKELRIIFIIYPVKFVHRNLRTIFMRLHLRMIWRFIFLPHFSENASKTAKYIKRTNKKQKGRKK